MQYILYGSEPLNTTYSNTAFMQHAVFYQVIGFGIILFGMFSNYMCLSKYSWFLYGLFLGFALLACFFPGTFSFWQTRTFSYYLCLLYPLSYALLLYSNREKGWKTIVWALRAVTPVFRSDPMYLHTTMEDMEGNAWEMADVIDGRAYKTEKLGRFGYIELTGNAEDRKFLGQDVGALRAHEFHYFDSTSCGTDFHAKKPLRKRSWDCIHGTETQLFGFPHLYYYSNPALALEFLEACVRQRSKNV